MIRATCIAAAVCVLAVPSGAQNPPLPDLPDMPEMPEMPYLPDMPDMPEMLDVHDLEFRLDALRDMNMNFHLPPMPDMNFEMPDMDMDFTPMNDMLEHMNEAMTHLDFDMDMTPMPAMPPIPPIPPMPHIPPVAAMAPMARTSIVAWTTAAVALAPAAAAAEASRVLTSIARIGGQSPFARQFGGIANDPPESWAGSDPADSLYRLAREALNHGEYRRAARSLRFRTPCSLIVTLPCGPMPRR